MQYAAGILQFQDYSSDLHKAVAAISGLSRFGVCQLLLQDLLLAAFPGWGQAMCY